MICRISEPARFLIDDREELARMKKGTWLSLKAENRSPYLIAVCFAFWETGKADYMRDPDCTVMMGVLPGLPVQLALDMNLLGGQVLFPERTSGKLKTFVKGRPVKPGQIDRLEIFAAHSHNLERTEKSVFLSELSIEINEPVYPLPKEKYMDSMGQWSRKSWTGKTHSEEEMVQLLRKELSLADKSFADYGLSRFGGYPDKQFSPSGFFRSVHDGKRWWLADPDGYAFYSVGVDCINEGIECRTDGIESLFEWLPSKDSPFGDCIKEDARGSRTFNFGQANLIKAFGEEWWESWARIIKNRLLEWGFNTIGNWSSNRLIEWADMPYVLNMQNFPDTTKKIFRDFPDVFSHEFERNSRLFGEQLSTRKDDPRMIGYFMRNEPNWAFVPDLNLAEMMLESTLELESREKFIEWMETKYQGDPSALSDAWNLPGLSSFSDLNAPLERACGLSKRAEEDLKEFSALMIETYNSLPAKACRAVDPNHMNLGMRWAWVGDESLYKGSELFDVFSLNSYDTTPVSRIDPSAQRTGLPVLIGEFHHGGLDRGLPANGIRGVKTQEERAQAYRLYVETAASHKSCVGTHYFQFNDQALLGRFDGENFQIGLIDICYKPYFDFVEGVGETNRKLKEILSEKRNPPSEGPEEFTVGF